MSEPYGATSGLLGPWADRLRVASWRGLPFAVKGGTLKRGRRVVVHEYPFRDDVWVEDLGRGVRLVGLTGFLIGDDVFDQRDAMMAANEQPGIGELVHPSLGSLQVTQVDESFGERADLGRVVEMELSFIQGQDVPVYPDGSASTQEGVDDAADSADDAAGADFIVDVALTVAASEAAVLAVVDTVTDFAGDVLAVIGGAAAIANAVLGLVPPAGAFFGRYSTVGIVAMLPRSATVASQLNGQVAAGATLAATATAAISAASGDVTMLPAAVQAMPAGIIATIAGPTDQIAALETLVAEQESQTATAALCRRAALTALCRACANYQPTSYDDAAAVRKAVTAPLDAEVTFAADAGDNATFVAFRTLRAAVVLDLVTRGSLLPRVTTVVRRAPLPSLALAYSLYGDASRSDDLLARVDPPHPAFFPLSFTALSY